MKNLSDEVKAILETYADDVTDSVQEAVEKVTKQGVSLVKEKSQSAGFDDKEYHKGWTADRHKSRYGAKNSIWNKSHYQLAHLLENGHMTVSGTRTRAFPHIAPAEEEINDMLVDEITKAVSK